METLLLEEEVSDQAAAESAQPIDQAKAEQFAGKMLQAMNGAALVLMTSIGQKTGLFNVIAELKPSTSAEIADAAGLDERYVREWLAVMVTCAVVEYDPSDRTYRLPGEHAAFLTERATPNNMAVTAQFFPEIGRAEEAIVHCFRNGGGTTYEMYPQFHQIMCEQSAQTIVANLEASILPLVEGIQERLESGIRVLDVGCGAARAIMTLAERFPRSEFVGLDLSEPALDIARRIVAEKGRRNLSFACADAATFVADESFDLITAFDAVHDQPDPQAVLNRIHALLKDDGVFLMQDIGGSARLENNLESPVAPMLYAISCMHCMAVSLGQGGAGLGTMWGVETAEAFLRNAGFKDIQVHRLPHDILNAYFVARKG